MPRGPEYSKPNQEWRAPPKPQPENQANPLVPFLREQHGQGERSHEELVGSIRQELAAWIEGFKRIKVKYDPVDAMREVFLLAQADFINKYCPEQWDKPFGERPHDQLYMAWSVIAQPYYKSERSRRLGGDDQKFLAEHLGHTIILDPNEGKLLAAMAEAVGIPNPSGPMPPEKK
jgi:hypothetical protein